jgi:transposase
MKSKAYRAVDVKRVEVASWLDGRLESEVFVGLDVGKEAVLCDLRWGQHDFDRPWRVSNPSECGLLADKLAVVAQGRRMIVAMEPTGTYGDALRQALQKVGLEVHRVSPKQASDYAEVFDGVPSQHDGKDAAVIAELAAQGRSWAWPMVTPTEAEQELAYHVEWMDGQRRQMMLYCGRVEALLSRHWPEATRVLPMGSATLLKCLAKHGGPRGLAAAPDALQQVQRWGGSYLSAAKAQQLVDSARQTAGVTMGRWDEERLRRYAEVIRQCKAETRAARRRLRELAKGHGAIGAMAKVVGMATACVLWVELGDPKAYHCGGAYRKSMGLNLAERSSGKWQGKLKISKRGSSQVRRWLYLAALRWVKNEPARSWYLHQKAARRGEGKAALIGVMRKLALALYQVGGRGARFDPAMLYPGARKPAPAGRAVGK